jgi:N-acylneuraminate cytidylyltransferase/CMP-N,N'-diacetyllegionaminic acid synthase
MDKLSIVSIIPIKGAVNNFGGRPLLEYTLKRSVGSKYINYTVVTSDNIDTLSLASRLGADFVLKRPPELSKEYIEITEVLKFAIDNLESKGLIPDIIVYMSITHPFREKELVDSMIKQLVVDHYDSILPVIAEYKSIWIRQNSRIQRIDQGFVPSKLKDPVYIGISGLGTVSYADVIKKGDRLGQRVELFELKDSISAIDVGKKDGFEIGNMIIDKWWKENQ